MDFYNKHYITIDANNCIIKGFSDAFEKPIETDICINQQGGRHFELNGEVNPSIINMDGCHLYKYEDRSIVETNVEEREAEFASFPKVVAVDPTEEYLVDLDYRISRIELGV